MGGGWGGRDGRAGGVGAWLEIQHIVFVCDHPLDTPTDWICLPDKSSETFIHHSKSLEKINSRFWQLLSSRKLQIVKTELTKKKKKKEDKNVWSGLLRFNVKTWARKRKLSGRRSPFTTHTNTHARHAHTHTHTYKSSFSGCQISQSNNSAISANFSSVLNVPPLVFMETFLAELSCMFGPLLLPVPLFPILYYTVNISPRLSFIFQVSALLRRLLDLRPFSILLLAQCSVGTQSCMVSNEDSRSVRCSTRPLQWFDSEELNYIFKMQR